MDLDLLPALVYLKLLGKNLRCRQSIWTSNLLGDRNIICRHSRKWAREKASVWERTLSCETALPGGAGTSENTLLCSTLKQRVEIKECNSELVHISSIFSFSISKADHGFDQHSVPPALSPHYGFQSDRDFKGFESHFYSKQKWLLYLERLNRASNENANATVTMHRPPRHWIFNVFLCFGIIYFRLGWVSKTSFTSPDCPQSHFTVWMGWCMSWCVKDFTVHRLNALSAMAFSTPVFCWRAIHPRPWWTWHVILIRVAFRGMFLRLSCISCYPLKVVMIYFPIG